MERIRIIYLPKQAHFSHVTIVYFHQLPFSSVPKSNRK